MPHWIINTLITVGAFVAMECVAWLAHKYLMHGLLWFLHHDHHQRDDGDFFEKNDYFFVIFATPGIAFLWLGLNAGFNYLFWIGLGITIYGFTYFLVHDIFIHQRFKALRNSDSVYLKAIRRAHKMHHKHLGKHDGECYGMLWVPLKYFREAQKANAK
ncbi:sterol desaturase family protein [Dyadobacter sp. CY261]|uniref:sterol desaturase family protein n=1 Tax=Dyadobacter sp. CY261 TaxID=2907203 RepID=UPI001F3B708A|nr:sterol desaturase family protein [Dyadobacter sp. CY261]MCF0073831.1 sterol desaturase family protein [Dyadobacter sp. CY261]